MKETLITEAQVKVPNIYVLINVAARRTEQVMQGAAPSVLLEGASAIEVALQEITEGKIESSEDGRLWTVAL